MRYRLACAVVLAVLVASVNSPQPVIRAAPRDDRTFNVNNPADEPAAMPYTDGLCNSTLGTGVCTLRAAIMKANHWHLGSVTINLPHLAPGQAYLLTIFPTGSDGEDSGDLNIVDSPGRPQVVISGDGAANTIIDASGMVPSDRVLSITVGASVSIAGITIRGAHVADLGGGIANSGTLTLVATTITGNRADLSGGGIYNAGSLSLIYSTVSGNFSSLGGGIRNDGSAGGQGQLFLTSSTLSGNIGDIRGGGLDNTCGVAHVTNSTVSGNTTYDSGGGIANRYINCASALYLDNVTVADNEADVYPNKGGGVDTEGLNFLAFRDTILSNNHLGSGEFIPGDCAGTLNSYGYNLVSSMADCTIVGNLTGVITDTFALLRPLGNYGGPTQTQALNPGSRAIDGGSPGGCIDEFGSTLNFDQRGAPRPANGAGAFICDIGAFEVQRMVFLPVVRR